MSHLAQPDQIDTTVSFGLNGLNDTPASFRPTSSIHTTVSFGPTGSNRFLTETFGKLCTTNIFR